MCISGTLGRREIVTSRKVKKYIFIKGKRFIVEESIFEKFIELFKTEEDTSAYIRLLKEYQTKYQFNLFSYALTSKKVHLLLEPLGDVSTSQFMRDLTSLGRGFHPGLLDGSGK